MKKILVLFLALFLLTAASCSDDASGTTEPETHPPVEITTAPPLDITEMSPDTMDVTPPENIEAELKNISFDSFKEIEAEDSVFPQATHDKILESENAQYFFVNDDIKVHAVYFDENKRVSYSVSYNIKTGYAEFIGDAEKSWYFDETGKLKTFVYSYTFGGTSDAPIYTFYSPEGEKEVTRTMNGWYSPDFDLLSNDEIMDFLDRYKGTVEATAEYKPSKLTG